MDTDSPRFDAARMPETLLSKLRHRSSACWEQPHCPISPLSIITCNKEQDSLTDPDEEHNLSCAICLCKIPAAARYISQKRDDALSHWPASRNRCACPNNAEVAKKPSARYYVARTQKCGNERHSLIGSMNRSYRMDAGLTDASC